MKRERSKQKILVIKAKRLPQVLLEKICAVAKFTWGKVPKRNGGAHRDEIRQINTSFG